MYTLTREYRRTGSTDAVNSCQYTQFVRSTWVELLAIRRTISFPSSLVDKTLVTRGTVNQIAGIYEKFQMQFKKLVHHLPWTKKGYPWQLLYISRVKKWTLSVTFLKHLCQHYIL